MEIEQATYTGIDVDQAPGAVGRDVDRDHVDPVLAQHGHHQRQHAGLPRQAHADDRLLVRHAQRDVRRRPRLEPGRPRGRGSKRLLLRRHSWAPAIRHGRHPVRGLRRREQGGHRGLGGGLPRERLLLLPPLQLGLRLLQGPDEVDRLSHQGRLVDLPDQKITHTTAT